MNPVEVGPLAGRHGCGSVHSSYDSYVGRVNILAAVRGGLFSRLANISNRLWQDVKVGTMHPLVSLSSHYETYGRMLSGIEPPLMLV